MNAALPRVLSGIEGDRKYLGLGMEGDRKYLGLVLSNPSLGSAGRPQGQNLFKAGREGRAFSPKQLKGH